MTLLHTFCKHVSQSFVITLVNVDQFHQAICHHLAKFKCSTVRIYRTVIQFKNDVFKGNIHVGVTYLIGYAADYLRIVKPQDPGRQTACAQNVPVDVSMTRCSMLFEALSIGTDVNGT